jgi:hypothetical protein
MPLTLGGTEHAEMLELTACVVNLQPNCMSVVRAPEGDSVVGVALMVSPKLPSELGGRCGAAMRDISDALGSLALEQTQDSWWNAALKIPQDAMRDEVRGNFRVGVGVAEGRSSTSKMINGNLNEPTEDGGMPYPRRSQHHGFAGQLMNITLPIISLVLRLGIA